jgi:glycosyltransferase involved in cell wall biosynthesis
MEVAEEFYPAPSNRRDQLKILIYSRPFSPSVGGQEVMMEILAEEFVSAGHQVRVVTQTGNAANRHYPYDVVRLPSLRCYAKALDWSEVCLCAGVSLRGLWPMIIRKKPYVISHQTVHATPRRFSLEVQIKRAITSISTNVSCSHSVQTRIGGPSTVIPNTYRSEIFKEYGDVHKDLDVVFVGRLVSDKGVEDLIRAFSQLSQIGLRPQLSIVGDGPDLPSLLERVSELHLTQQIKFLGVKQGHELARIIARHRVMAVPSRWPEPFGIVALEGLACGCVVVGTNGGGLPEAIGSSGITVPPGDYAAMAEALRLLLSNEPLHARYRLGAREHLARHSPRVIARRYLDALILAQTRKMNLRSIEP